MARLGSSQDENEVSYLKRPKVAKDAGLASPQRLFELVSTAIDCICDSLVAEILKAVLHVVRLRNRIENPLRIGGRNLIQKHWRQAPSALRRRRQRLVIRVYICDF